MSLVRSIANRVPEDFKLAEEERGGMSEGYARAVT